MLARRAAPTTRKFGATRARFWTVFRSAPWSPATGSALYANRTLLELIGYRDFAEFQAANALSRMFRDRDPQAMTAEDVGAVAIVRADGQVLSVDGHAQVIGWDGAPATLIALRRSLEAELRARMRVAESEAATPRRSWRAATFRRCSTARATAPSRSIWPAASCR